MRLTRPRQPPRPARQRQQLQLTAAAPPGGPQRGAQWERALHWFQVLCRDAADADRAGRPERAEALAPDVVTFNALISACEKGGQWRLVRGDAHSPIRPLLAPIRPPLAPNLRS